MRRRWTLDNGLPVEWYAESSYITVTGGSDGDVFDAEIVEDGVPALPSTR